MNSETVLSPVDESEAASQRLRQLAHDLRTPLSIMSMGLEVLQHVRNDDEQFGEMCRMMSREGIEKIKALIEALAPSDDRGPSSPR